MRVIVFRGKSIYTGDWLFGSLVTQAENGPTILHQGLGETVGVETIGQFTGVDDKNGIGIFEGDIYHMGDQNITYTTIWQDSGFKGKQNGSSSFAGLESWKEKIEIIGNIHDDPELLDK